MYVWNRMEMTCTHLLCFVGGMLIGMPITLSTLGFYSHQKVYAWEVPSRDGAGQVWRYVNEELREEYEQRKQRGIIRVFPGPINP